MTSTHDDADTTDAAITDAVVLAGGEGRRLRPLTTNRPKPMLPAANRPILEHVFDALLANGVETIHLVVGYKRDRVQGYFGTTHRGVPIQYHRQDKQLGSGHALLQAAAGVSGTFLAVNGDQLTEPRIVGDVIAAHDGSAGRATLGVVESEKAPNYGVVELDGTRVTRFIERPGDESYRLLNAGVYGFDEAIFEAIERTAPVDGTLDLPQVISALIAEDEPVRGVLTDGYWMDATYPWDLLRVARRLLDEGEIAVEGDGDGRYVADSEGIHEAAVVRPPVVVSQDCEVGPGAVVGPDAALGRNVTVGANAVVAESVLDGDTRVGPGSTLLRTVTGQDVDVGPGCTVPGGRADVVIDDTVHRDRRLGAVLADRVTAVGDVGVVPGALVGPNATLHAGARVEGRIPEGAEVVR